MAPSLFRETVALVADRAKAILPQTINGRLEGAVRLVLSHDVEPQADGSILVGSASDPLKTYRLVGTTCECKDFTDGKAPVDEASGQRWCRHRIAAGIMKRVQEELPQEFEVYPDNDPEEPLPPELAPEPVPAPLPEAPASVNVRVTIGGREVQWTLRDSDEGRLALRLDALLARYPAPAQPLAPQQHGALAQHQTVTGWCKVHNVAMQENHKDGRTWQSHRTDQGWCKGR